MGNAQIGKCNLCGKETSLTFEHVPPENSFNSFAVKEYPFEESIKMMTGADGRKPWDFSGLRGKINQRGGGGYYLCESCNSNTGSWYISEYVQLTNVLHSIIQEEAFEPGNRYAFQVKQLYPLRVFKAIMTMFCDINNECFGDERLREYLLDKESMDFDFQRYSVYMYLVSPQMRRVSSLAAMMALNTEIVMLSEIASYPLGVTLYIDKPENYSPGGLLMNDFAEHPYDDLCNVDFLGIPYYEINSQLPDDFRLKSEFKKSLGSEENSHV